MEAATPRRTPASVPAIPTQPPATRKTFSTVRGDAPRTERTAASPARVAARTADVAARFSPATITIRKTAANRTMRSSLSARTRARFCSSHVVTATEGPSAAATAAAPAFAARRVLQEDLVAGGPVRAEREEAPRLVERQARLGGATSRGRGREGGDPQGRDDRDRAERRKPRARRDERHRRLPARRRAAGPGPRRARAPSSARARRPPPERRRAPSTPTRGPAPRVKTDTTPGTAASLPPIRSASWNGPRPAGVTRRCGVSARSRLLTCVWNPARSASDTTSAATPSARPQKAASATTPTCASRRDARRYRRARRRDQEKIS